jgi:hypothetical protein
MERNREVAFIQEHKERRILEAQTDAIDLRQFHLGIETECTSLDFSRIGHLIVAIDELLEIDLPRFSAWHCSVKTKPLSTHLQEQA